MSTDTTSCVLLDVDAVAAELGISNTEADRLVARKFIPATRIGDSGPYKIVPAALEQYVSRGAPDVRWPGEFMAGSTWFNDDLRNSADAFYGAVIEASKEQVLSDEAIRAKFAADLRSTSLDFAIENKGAVADVLSQPVPVSIYAPADAPKSRFSKWLEVYTTDLLRRVALQGIRTRNLMDVPVDVLYKSPEDFQAIVDEAYAEAATRRIVWSKSFTFSGPPFGVVPVGRRASFLFSLSNVFTPAAKARLIALAF